MSDTTNLEIQVKKMNLKMTDMISRGKEKGTANHMSSGWAACSVAEQLVVWLAESMMSLAFDNAVSTAQCMLNKKACSSNFCLHKILIWHCLFTYVPITIWTSTAHYRKFTYPYPLTAFTFLMKFWCNSDK